MPILHLELPDNANEELMQFKMKGDPKVISKMVAYAMDVNPDVSALFITAVLGWAHKRKVSFEMLNDIFYKHKPK